MYFFKTIMYCLGKPQAKDIKYKIQEDHYALGGEGVRTNVVGPLTNIFCGVTFQSFLYAFNGSTHCIAYKLYGHY